MLPLSAEIQSGRRDKPDGQTRTSHGCVRTTWLPPVSSHLASAGAGPERYAAVVKPPGRGGFWILKVTQGPFPESAARFDFGQVGAPRPLGDVASFGDDTPTKIRICEEVAGAFDRGRAFVASSLLAGPCSVKPVSNVSMSPNTTSKRQRDTWDIKREWGCLVCFFCTNNRL